MQLQLVRCQSRLMQLLLHPNTQVKAQGHVRSAFASGTAHRCPYSSCMCCWLCIPMEMVAMPTHALLPVWCTSCDSPRRLLSR